MLCVMLVIVHCGLAFRAVPNKAGVGGKADSVQEDVKTIAKVDAMDYLKVVYKYCFAKAMHDYVGWENEEYGPYPVIRQIDGDGELSAYEVWEMQFKESFECSFELTTDATKQQQVSCDGCENFTAKPDRAWYDVAALLPEGEKETLENALLGLYKLAAVPQSNWIISLNCGTSCKKAISSGVGEFKFTADRRVDHRHKANFTSSSRNGKYSLSAAEAKDGFVTACKSMLETLDPKYAGISNDLCTTREFTLKKEGDDQIVENVGWQKDGLFEWQ